MPSKGTVESRRRPGDRAEPHEEGDEDSHGDLDHHHPAAGQRLPRDDRIRRHRSHRRAVLRRHGSFGLGGVHASDGAECLHTRVARSPDRRRIDQRPGNRVVVTAGVPPIDADRGSDARDAAAGSSSAGSATSVSANSASGTSSDRGSGSGSPPPSSGSVTSVVVLGLGGAVALGLAVALFSWDRKNATRRMHPAVGLLAIVPYVVGALLA